jgi:hypothetical protein
MLVKDLVNPINKKVIDPQTGKIGIFKGFFDNGIFLGIRKCNSGQVYPINVSKKDFQEWELARDNESVTIQDLFYTK